MDNNLSLEIFRFKVRLRELDLDDSTIERSVQEFNTRMQSAINDILNEGLSEAQSTGVAKESKEFLAELRTDARNTLLYTESGRTDFSVEPFSMRESILKNAKVSKDGSRYKVIPVGTPSRDNPFALSSADVAKYASKEQQDQFKRKLDARHLGKSLSSKKEFRTVSDKQDPQSWQHPGFQRDFTGDLSQINSDMKYKVHQQAQEIMREIEDRAYRGEV